MKGMCERTYWGNITLTIAIARVTLQVGNELRSRFGSRALSSVEQYKQHTPVLVDDIISTARTMIETSHALKEAGMKRCVCIGVHALFSGDSYQALTDAWVEKVVTTNTILHETNGIDVTPVFAGEISS